MLQNHSYHGRAGHFRLDGSVPGGTRGKRSVLFGRAARAGTAPGRGGLPAVLEGFFQIPGAQYWIWEEEGRYVSCLRLKPDRDGLLLEALETRPDCRRRGFGKQLILSVLSHLPRGTKIYSEISKENLPSLAIHRVCGFSQVLDYGLQEDGSKGGSLRDHGSHNIRGEREIMGFFSKIKEGLTKTRKSHGRDSGQCIFRLFQSGRRFLRRAGGMPDPGRPGSGDCRKGGGGLRRRVKEEKIREPEEAKSGP